MGKDYNFFVLKIYQTVNSRSVANVNQLYSTDYENLFRTLCSLNVMFLYSAVDCIRIPSEKIIFQVHSCERKNPNVIN